MPNHLDDVLIKLGFQKEKSGEGNFLGSWRGMPPLPRNLTVSLYTGRGGLKMVSSDPEGFRALLSGINLWTDSRPVIQLDDALWGCPLGGLLLGCMGPSKKVLLSSLQPQLFRDRQWATAVADTAQILVENTIRDEGLTKSTCILEICPAPVLTVTRRRLSLSGFVVRTGNIQGRLQSKLAEAGQLHLSETYGLPLNKCQSDGVTIAQYALKSGVPREAFKWAFETGSGRFDPKQPTNIQLELGKGDLQC